MATGLSHCRHMIKVRHSVAHLVSTTIVHPRDVTDDVTKGSPLSEREWAEFSQLSSSEVRGRCVCVCSVTVCVCAAWGEMGACHEASLSVWSGA